jgi:hypothetical protein
MSDLQKYADEKLIARLRVHRYNTWKDDLGPEPDKKLAADRIEQLAVTNEALEAKLAKAMEALEWQASQPEAHPFMAANARATLADIKSPSKKTITEWPEENGNIMVGKMKDG